MLMAEAAAGREKCISSRAMKEKIRDAVIMIYMVGNALTFTKVLFIELAGLQQTDQLIGKVVAALLLSIIWPLYWIGRAFLG